MQVKTSKTAAPRNPYAAPRNPYAGIKFTDAYQLFLDVNQCQEYSTNRQGYDFSFSCLAGWMKNRADCELFSAAALAALNKLLAGYPTDPVDWLFGGKHKANPAYWMRAAVDQGWVNFKSYSLQDHARAAVRLYLVNQIRESEDDFKEWFSFEIVKASHSKISPAQFTALACIDFSSCQTLGDLRKCVKAALSVKREI